MSQDRGANFRLELMSDGCFGGGTTNVEPNQVQQLSDVSAHGGDHVNVLVAKNVVREPPRHVMELAREVLEARVPE